MTPRVLVSKSLARKRSSPQLVLGQALLRTMFLSQATGGDHASVAEIVPASDDSAQMQAWPGLLSVSETDVTHLGPATCVMNTLDMVHELHKFNVMPSFSPSDSSFSETSILVSPCSVPEHACFAT